MSNILIVGGGQSTTIASRYYEYANRLANGFTRLGHNVLRVSDKDLARLSNPLGLRKLGITKANDTFVGHVRDARPEIVLFKHANVIRPETIERIREIAPATKIFQINIDALFTVDNVRRIREKSASMDATFVTTGGDAMDDVAGGKPIYYAPNIVDAAIDTGRAFETECRNDVFLAVGNAEADPMRARLIDALRGKGDLWRLRLVIAAQKGLWGADYIDEIAHSKCAINLSRESESGVIGSEKHFHMYSSDRLAHLVGNGALAFSDARFHLDRLFTSDEMVFYRDADDLMAQLERALSDDVLRKRMAQAAWIRAHRDYSAENLATLMLDVARNGGPTRDYSWPLR